MIKSLLLPFFTSMLLLLTLTSIVYAQELVDFKFKVKPTQDNVCVQNSATAIDPDTESIEGQSSAVTQVGAPQEACEQGEGVRYTTKIATVNGKTITYKIILHELCKPTITIKDILPAGLDLSGTPQINVLNTEAIDPNDPDLKKFTINANREVIWTIKLKQSYVDKCLNIIATPTDGNYQKAIKDQFNIQMNGYDDQHLKWAYEKLAEVTKTRFDDILKTYNIVMNAKVYTSADPTSFAGYTCEEQMSVIQGFPTDSAEIFKITFTHELSHKLRKCTSASISFYNEHLNALNLEGGVTYYGQYAGDASKGCPTVGVNRESEDYAETLAYYLNPGLRQKDVCGTGRLEPPYAGRLEPPYAGRAHPLHYDVAKRVLGDFP